MPQRWYRTRLANFYLSARAAQKLAIVHRELIITLAARYRLPAVYFYRFFVTAGGLISYGPDSTDQFRRAAGYVRRGVIIPWVNLSVTGNGGPCQR